MRTISGHPRLHELCETEWLVTCDPHHVFLPVVYTLIFILGITGNGLVVVVLGCQHRLGSCIIKQDSSMSLEFLLSWIFDVWNLIVQLVSI